MYFRQLDPSEVIPTTGRAKRGARATRQAPTTAPAACAKADWHRLLRPYKPPAHSTIIKSGGMRSGGNKGENDTVDSTTLGTPSGKLLATSSARSVPMVPPSTSRPSMRPSRCSWTARADAPWAIRAMALFSSPLSMTCCSVTPAACATSVLAKSGTTCPLASTPTSMMSARPPAACTCSRMKPISSLLVSTVPTIRMTGLFMRGPPARQQTRLRARRTSSPLPRG